MRYLAAMAAAAAVMIATAPPGAAQQHAPAHPAQVRHETQADLARQAHVSEPAARRTALAVVPHGQVKDHELEREHGQLIYSYDIQVPGRAGIEEIQVSALNGRIVSREHESPAAMRAEARADAREHQQQHPKPR